MVTILETRSVSEGRTTARHSKTPHPAVFDGFPLPPGEGGFNLTIKAGFSQS